MNAPTVKSCLTCGREIFSTYRGDVTIKPPARVERVEANGNIVCQCTCGRRLVWFKSRRAAQAVISAG